MLWQMALFMYFLYTLTVLSAGILTYYFLNRPKKKSRIGSTPVSRYNFVRKVLPLDGGNWKLIEVDNGLRVWAMSGHKSLHAASAIIPASLKVVEDVLTDPTLILAYSPLVESASRISVSNGQESASMQTSSDVISFTETSFFSKLGVFESLIELFKSDSKIFSRTWHFEKDVKFWLHTAVVEPCSSDPVFTLFIAFPCEGKDEKCQIIAASEPRSTSSPSILSTSLAGLQDLIVHRQSEVIMPEMKVEDEKQNAVTADAEESSVDDDDEEKLNGGQKDDNNTSASSEDFVDVTGVYYTPEKDLKKYKVTIDEAVKRLMECYNAKDEEDGWGLVGNIKGVEIMKKPASPGFSQWDCSKGTTEINVPLHFLLAYLDDLETTSEYDDMFDKGQVIESIGDLTKIVYMEYRGIWPVSGRDFCSISATRILPDNFVVQFAKHIQHPSCPPGKKLVRGKILCGGFVMKILSEDPPRILTTYVTHVDLSGSVPSRIVNKVTANQPASVGIVKQVVEKLYEDEQKNPKSPSKLKQDADSYYEKLQRARAVTVKISDEKLNEVPSETLPNLATSEAMNGDERHDTDVEDINQSSLSNGANSLDASPTIQRPHLNQSALDYKMIGNQACAGLMQEAFEVSEVDITKPAGPSVHEQWQYQETEKKVLIFRKTHEKEKIHSFIGKGIIACSPPKVWEILKEPENAYRYNIMLKETRTLEKPNDTQRIEYLHFQTEKCFKKEARDFIALRTDRKEKDKYLISFVSIDYPDGPSKKDVKRGKIIASGFVVEPLLHNGQLYSMVTYLAQINPRGSIPAVLINVIGKKQPLCIAYLRRLLEYQSLTTSTSERRSSQGG